MLNRSYWRRNITRLHALEFNAGAKGYKTDKQDLFNHVRGVFLHCLWGRLICVSRIAVLPS